MLTRRQRDQLYADYIAQHKAQIHNSVERTRPLADFCTAATFQVAALTVFFLLIKRCTEACTADVGVGLLVSFAIYTAFLFSLAPAMDAIVTIVVLYLQRRLGLMPVTMQVNILIRAFTDAIVWTITIALQANLSSVLLEMTNAAAGR